MSLVSVSRVALIPLVLVLLVASANVASKTFVVYRSEVVASIAVALP